MHILLLFDQLDQRAIYGSVTVDRVCDRHFYINLTIRDKTRGTADRQSSALGWNRIDRLNLRGTSGLRRGTGKWDGGAGSKKGYDFWTEAFGRDLKGWGGGGELRKRTSKRHCSAAGAEGICRGPAVWLTSLTYWIIFFCLRGPPGCSLSSLLCATLHLLPRLHVHRVFFFLLSKLQN